MYHIMKRISEVIPTELINADDGDPDPYIVDKILKKRFHAIRNHYEFLVSWVGYSDTNGKLQKTYHPISSMNLKRMVVGYPQVQVVE